MEAAASIAKVLRMDPVAVLAGDSIDFMIRAEAARLMVKWEKEAQQKGSRK